MILFIDTETSGLPRDYKAPSSKVDNWPHLVTASWIRADDNTVFVERNFIRKPEGFTIPTAASDIHGVTQEMAERDGVPISDILAWLLLDLAFCEAVVAHNLAFDKAIIEAEVYRLGEPSRLPFDAVDEICTMEIGTPICRIQGQYGYKWPRLTELYEHLFGDTFGDQHTSLADVQACARCFWELQKTAS